MTQPPGELVMLVMKRVLLGERLRGRTLQGLAGAVTAATSVQLQCNERESPGAGGATASAVDSVLIAAARTRQRGCRHTVRVSSPCAVHAGTPARQAARGKIWDCQPRPCGGNSVRGGRLLIDWESAQRNTRADSRPPSGSCQVSVCGSAAVVSRLHPAAERRRRCGGRQKPEHAR